MRVQVLLVVAVGRGTGIKCSVAVVLACTLNIFVLSQAFSVGEIATFFLFGCRGGAAVGFVLGEVIISLRYRSHIPVLLVCEQPCVTAVHLPRDVL